MSACIRPLLSGIFLFALFPFALTAQLVNRAPDVYPGTLPEMRTPVWWIARMSNPDEVLIASDRIKHMNESFLELIKRPDPFGDIPDEQKPSLISWWPGSLTSEPDIDSMAPEILADSVKSWISAEAEYLGSGRFGNVAGVPYSRRDIERFEKEMAFDRIARTITVQQGIAVRYTQLRVIPSLFAYEQGISDSALSVSGKIIKITVHWDTWNNGFLKIGNTVSVLHASRSGEFLFVLNDTRYGWVRAEDIALGNKKAIAEYGEVPDFVVCTGNRVTFYTDSDCRLASGWFGMGDRLPLALKSNPRMIRIPMRTYLGRFSTGTAWLDKNADAHVGWLPYTRRNVVLTAFKLLDTPYDWSGAWFGRDHITTYRDIFAVFGFTLPRHDGLFAFYGDNKKNVMIPEIGRDRQYRTILEHEPFVTIMSCGGHAKLFLGEYNGMPIVFDHYGHGYTDENGEYVELCRSFIGDMKIPAYFLNRPVSFLELKKE